MKPVIVIPAYQPEPILITLVKQLVDLRFALIIVNDGSNASFHSLFSTLNNFSNVKVLHHAVNLGKGQALKTAFNYFLNHYSQSVGVVTADADGQHLVKDIQKVAEHLLIFKEDLTLGTRTFKNGIPWRSRFGNRLTRLLFQILIKQSLQDTQTGLRAIPQSFLTSLLKTPSNGYDFELDMLISAVKQKIKINEIPIQTIYENNNKSSHFNPLIDSFKIYFVFVRFLFFSILSGVFDFLAFSLIFIMSQHILFSETLARFFSGTCNFLFNKELVFKSSEKILPEALKYTLLCLANLFFSYTLILCLTYLNINVFMSKLLSLFTLFIANFAIQKICIFGKKETSM